MSRVPLHPVGLMYFGALQVPRPAEGLRHRPLVLCEEFTMAGFVQVPVLYNHLMSWIMFHNCEITAAYVGASAYLRMFVAQPVGPCMLGCICNLLLMFS